MKREAFAFKKGKKMEPAVNEILRKVMNHS